MGTNTCTTWVKGLLQLFLGNQQLLAVSDRQFAHQSTKLAQDVLGLKNTTVLANHREATINKRAMMAVLATTVAANRVFGTRVHHRLIASCGQAAIRLIR
jgi:hypothetical protein